MPQLIKNRLIVAAIESTYGTLPTLGAGNAYLVENLKINVESEQLTRNPHKPSLSLLAPSAGRTKANVTFSMHMYGGLDLASPANPTVGSPPPYGIFLRACGMQETIVASTSATYKPMSTGFESVGIRVYLDGVAAEIRGCRGTFSFKGEAGQLPMIEFNLSGLWNPILDAPAIQDLANITPTSLAGFTPDAFLCGVFTIDSLESVSQSLEFAMNNTITYMPSLNSCNYQRVDITGRDPSGSTDAESILTATKDFWVIAANKTPVVIQAYVGAIDTATPATTGGVTVTDATKSWPVNLFQTGYSFLDGAGVTKDIASNTATALTLATGSTVAAGKGVIYKPGRLHKIRIPNAVFSGPNDNDTNGIFTLGLPFLMAGTNTGDDEIEITAI